MFVKATITTAVCVGAALGGAIPSLAGYAAAPVQAAYAGPRTLSYSAAPVAVSSYSAPRAFAYSAPVAVGAYPAAPVAPTLSYAPAAYAPSLSYGAIASPLKVAAAAPAPVAFAAAVPRFAAPVVPAPIAKAAIVEPVYPPQPYQFGYESVDEYGTKQSRQESSDANNNKSGSYGFTDARGVFRQVNYVADAAGFRASIETNEPGTAPSAPASAVYNAAGPAKAVVAAPLLGKAAVGPVKVL